MLASKWIYFTMDGPVQKTSLHDEPVCICGYPKIGLPLIEDPCPECGSIVLAKYKSSFSYYGWNVALLSMGVDVLHFLTLLSMISVRVHFSEEFVFYPWLFLSAAFLSFSL